MLGEILEGLAKCWDLSEQVMVLTTADSCSQCLRNLPEKREIVLDPCRLGIVSRAIHKRRAG